MTTRSGRVFVSGILAGLISQNSDGDFIFSYDQSYLARPDAFPISLTLPLRAEPYVTRTLMPFFDGLISEGWLLDIAIENWKLNPRDRMGLLLTICRDCIGAVHVEEVTQ
jgi:serine/threonine-protein kinase HipA